MRLTQRLIAASGAMVLVAGAVVVAVPVSAAPTVVPAKTYKACANKDTGAIRLVVKGKKCKKSERKLEWNVQGPAGMAGPVGPQGPQGPQGVPGPQLTVRDANGTVLGQFSVLTPGPSGTLYVIFEGGAYSYSYQQAAVDWDRRQTSAIPMYLTNTCGGPAYYPVPATTPDYPAGGLSRLLQTFSDKSADAFAFAGGSTTLAGVTPSWQKNTAKACVPAGNLPAGSKVLPLTSVTPPPFAVGLITIG